MTPENKALVFCVDDVTREEVFIVFGDSKNSFFVFPKKQSLHFSTSIQETIQNLTPKENLKTKVSMIREINEYAVNLRYVFEEKLRNLDITNSNYSILLFNLVESLGRAL